MVLMFGFTTLTQSFAAPFAIQAPQHLKKDGTPDKRFKENKTKPAVHLKKDGTPDKRFKENKKKK